VHDLTVQIATGIAGVRSGDVGHSSLSGLAV
jgi:hypothetical protein